MNVDSNYDDNDNEKPPKLSIGEIIESQNDYNKPVILNIKEKVDYTNNNDKLKPILLKGDAELTKQDNDKIKNLFSKLKPAKVSFQDIQIRIK